jgi:transcriptional regulator GlxA family with amidase domain
VPVAGRRDKRQKRPDPQEYCHNRPVHRIVVLALTEVVAFDLAIPAHVFGHRDERDHYSFAICASEAGLVPSTTGYAVQAAFGLEALNGADTVVVPGYAPHAEPPGPVLEALCSAADRGARVVSVCTGAFALAAAGLLDGRRATTHWKDADELAARYPAVDVDADVLYVDAGPVLTSAGVAAGIDLCLHLVRADLGEQAAARIARRMVVAPHRDGGQAQLLQRPVPSSGTGLSGTCAWALERLSEPVTVADLAHHAGWAPRTFVRRFRAETGTTPLRWLTAQRLLEARRLLELTDVPVEQVASRCGLGTAANLRLHLARDAATTPTAYRRTYQGSRMSVIES